MIRNLMLRYHRWRVWRTMPGSDARRASVRAYLRWCQTYGPRIDR